jgi:hypothetical protein
MQMPVYEPISSSQLPLNDGFLAVRPPLGRALYPLSANPRLDFWTSHGDDLLFLMLEAPDVILVTLQKQPLIP